MWSVAPLSRKSKDRLMMMMSNHWQMQTNSKTMKRTSVPVSNGDIIMHIGIECNRVKRDETERNALEWGRIERNSRLNVNCACNDFDSEFHSVVLSYVRACMSVCLSDCLYPSCVCARMYITIWCYACYCMSNWRQVGSGKGNSALSCGFLIHNLHYLCTKYSPFLHYTS